ncbi:Cell wall-binding protein [Candidatus Syntrophocurvum alkaliphilum]|uniref:Cell wall-binding protein n=1 Tax=Candidatus Syntrophocurvum alkaliphilum TaxID=2293317 RepID=A0A6I6DI33_9FIRM|nr:3D domain-containing protein [Candidatus Syntrophocurvum alkaliphilum]QGU00574.1 Cell wall-binding protein [Candidatus Syntrophocurvum alkaliphilum]
MNISLSRMHKVLLGIVIGALLLISAFYALQKPITIKVDGDVIETKALLVRTVEDVLEREQIMLGDNDLIKPSLNSIIEKETEIKITRASKVTIKADGETKEIYTTPIPVKEAIKLAGIELGEDDIVKTLPNPKTSPNQEIEVIRVTKEEKTVEEEIPYKTDRKPDDTLAKGLNRTVSQGANGVALNTVQKIYHNGEKVKEDVIDTEVIKQPQNRVIAMGNITSVSRGGDRLDFKEAIEMEATAYTHTGNRTFTGKWPEVGFVAVDPNVIPLGTELYVEGYGYARAEDTGGLIKGNKIDLFMEDRADCLSFGRRTVTVYVLE